MMLLEVLSRECGASTDGDGSKSVWAPFIRRGPGADPGIGVTRSMPVHHGSAGAAW